MGKGSIRRPGQNYGDGWDRIFNKEYTMDRDKQAHFKAKLAALKKRTEGIRMEVEAVCCYAINDWHHMTHQVSDFWPCDKSPVGMCVWDISERGFHIDVECRYCGDPVERK